MLPLEITIRDIEHTPAIDGKIRQKAEKLEQICDRITYCRVVVDAPQKNQHQGKLFQVNIEVDVPGKVLIVNNHSHRNEDLYVGIRDSFNAMKRQLEDYAQKIRGDKKSHTPQLTGRIVRLFDDYGFIEAPNGNEYYFHEANVNGNFKDLELGQAVRFTELAGGDGLQANHVIVS